MKLLVRKSFYDKLSKLEDRVEDHLKDKLHEIANDAINFTMGQNGRGRPAVDTGAYISSFSFALGRGRPRGKSSRGRQRGMLGMASSFATEARTELSSDIERANLDSSNTITLRNAAPHARYVEYKNGYLIFARLRRKHG